MNPDQPLPPSLFDRLRALPARVQAAVLVLLGLGVGGGAVIAVDRTLPTEPPAVEREVERPPANDQVRPPVRPTDPPTRPTDPPVRPPPDRPTPPTRPDTFAVEAFHEHSIYANAPGDLTVRDCTFGAPITPGRQLVYSADGALGSFAGQSFGGTEWGAWGPIGGLGHAAMNMFGPPQIDIAFRNCAWVAANHPGGQPSSMRWGVRAYAVDRVSYDLCQFSRGMGAGIQVALRASETGGSYPLGGHHVFERLTFSGIGDPKSERWGAFTISEHAPEGYGLKIAPIDVSIIDVRMVGGHLSWSDGNGKLVKSSRPIMIGGRRNVTIQRLHLDYEAPYDGWAVQVWDAAEVTVTDSYIREGRIELRNVGKVTLSGNSGGAQVYVGTHQNAAKPWPMETTIYSGPVTANYKTPEVK